MIKLDLNFPVSNLDGSPVIENGKTMFLHQFFANIMVGPVLKNVGDFMRKNSLAEQLYQTGVLELDEANLKLIKDIVADKEAVAPRIQCLITRVILAAESKKQAENEKVSA